MFTADGWYRTGDGGYFDEDGHFYFTGRLGDLIKSPGMNITPRDVELVLELHPDVVLAFVCGIPARRAWRRRRRRRRACRPARPLTEDELRAFVKNEHRVVQGAEAHRGVRIADRAADGSTRARSTAAR